MNQFTAICHNNNDTILIEGESYTINKHQLAPDTWNTWVEFGDDELFLLTFSTEELDKYFFNF